MKVFKKYVSPMNFFLFVWLFWSILSGSYSPQQQSDYTQSNSGSVTFIKNKPSGSDSVSYYNKSGRIYQRMKEWTDTITPTIASGQTVDISSAGFTKILSIQACSIRNTTTVTSVPNVAIKSYSTTSVSLNIIEGNGSVITLLGSGVLLGASNQFANTSGLTVFIKVDGY